MTWENIPDDISEYIGFVYIINERDTGMSYIGIKKFNKNIKYKPLKGCKNKRHIQKESDWREYNSSNKILQEKILKNPDNYQKTIIKCCRSQTELRCSETFLQLQYYFNGDWNKLYNQMINIRLRIPKNGLD